MKLERGPAFTQNAEHLPWLDGLRGLAALWVFASHVQILTGMRAIPVFSWGGLAVDLFMLLSGFLMAHHYLLRRHLEPWKARSTWLVFWLRRFFRIAPLYYVLLIAALILGPWLGDYRAAIASIWPATATPPARYHDQSLANILMHVSFLFGAVPEYAFRTPLPDWSIGLEMSFYLAFPFLMLMVSRLGAIKAGFVALLATLVVLYAFRDFFQQFEMPSFLPLKLYLFFIGIWIATSRLQGSMRGSLIASLAVLAVVCLVERTEQSVARIFLVVGMFYLMNNGSLPGGRLLDGIVHQIRVLLSNNLSKFLGDTSYSVYLLHLILVIPAAGMLTQHAGYLAANGLVRFAVCFLIAAPAVYLISWMLYRSIESTGIRIGKAVVRRFALPGKKPGIEQAAPALRPPDVVKAGDRL